MKQKRTYVTLLLVVALLALGIAYAYISNVDMSVTATATADNTPTPLKIAFTAGAEDEDQRVGNASVKEVVVNGAAATVTAEGFKVDGDKVVAELTLTNQQTDGVKAKITSVQATGTDNEWYTVTINGIEEDMIVEPGTPKTVTVTIEMDKTPATSANVEAATITMGLTFTAEAVSTATVNP